MAPGLQTPGTQPAPASRSRGVLWGGLGILAFSLTFPATRIALRDLDAGFITLGRAALGGLAAAGLLLALRSPIPAWQDLRRLLVVALGVVFGFPYFSAIALRHATVADAAVIAGLIPIVTASVAVLRGRERPSLTFWAAACTGFAAILVFAALQSDRTGSVSLGYLFAAVAAAGLGYAEGGVLSERLGATAVICWALVLVLPVTLPAAAIALVHSARSASVTTWAAFVYLGLFSMFLGFLALYRGMALGGAARIGQIQLIQPLLTLGWAGLLLHEPTPPTAWLCGLAVIASVTVSLWARVYHRLPQPEPVA